MKTFNVTFTDRQAAVLEEQASRLMQPVEKIVAALVCSDLESGVESHELAAHEGYLLDDVRAWVESGGVMSHAEEAFGIEAEELAEV